MQLHKKRDLTPQVFVNFWDLTGEVDDSWERTPYRTTTHFFNFTVMHLQVYNKLKWRTTDATP